MRLLSEPSAKHPKLTFALVGFVSIVVLLLSALPSVAPHKFPFLHPVSVDTDPENMLSQEEPVRRYHTEMKKNFKLYDMIVVGIVDENNEQGVFTKETLANIYQLTESIKEIRWQDDGGAEKGVVAVELMAPSTVDNIQPGDLGTVNFEWLMPAPPTSDAEALAIRDKAKRLPMFDGTLVSDSGDALAIYVPLTSKDVSYQVASKIEAEIAKLSGTAKYYVTGLPVAQDTFGVEMFVQMAISAPIAMLLIFILMWTFFRKVSLIISPLLVAMVAVLFAMGFLIINGNTIHIMSSMIPIFVMPIAVLDSVHIISEFFDRYQQSKDRQATISAVMSELAAPMFYTSLTTCAGFASLALTPIPPVQVFGIYVSLGVFFAWFFTVTLIPAYIASLPESSLEDFGLAHNESGDNEHLSIMGKAVLALGPFTYKYAKLILAAVVLFGIISAYGISKITINDNPVKWFTKSHKIRVADRELNKRFAGTYMAYLTLAPIGDPLDFETYKTAVRSIADKADPSIKEALVKEYKQLLSSDTDKQAFEGSLGDFITNQMDQAPDEQWEAWDAVQTELGALALQEQVFK
ncbi:MAG: MMPL family transporter, partial [Bdellovibrionales bacterium]|nr:MMPL family transporter [Bdellovibrionales bacterium]